MKDFQFFACMPDVRKSKSASKAFPKQPWTRATLYTYAEQGRYVECMGVFGETFGESMRECYGALQANNDQAICGSSVSRDYLRGRCVRISEQLARRLHPALFRVLDRG